MALDKEYDNDKNKMVKKIMNNIMTKDREKDNTR